MLKPIYIISPNPNYNKNGELIGYTKCKSMGIPELENFISKQLFPIGIVPGGVISYLRQKHLGEIKYIRDYVLSCVPCSKEHPTQISQLKDGIKMALIEGNIDVNELRSFDEEEVQDWMIAKANGELGPFGNIKKR